MDSAEYGRFSPLPPYRGGSHRPEGFIVELGSGIEAGSCHGSRTNDSGVDGSADSGTLTGEPFALGQE